MRMLLKSVTGILCLLATPVGLAGDGAIEIWEPTTITESGHYVLTRDIVGTNNLIRIAAERVHLDLNGFSIHNTALSDTVIVEAPSEEVVIENGSIIGGHHGLHVVVALRHLTVRRVTIRDTNTWAVKSHALMGVFEDNIIDNGGNGAWLNFSGSQVRHNVIRNSVYSDGVGLDIRGNANLVEANTVQLNAGLGLHVAGHNNQIIDSVLIGNGDCGLFISGFHNLYRTNLARGNSCAWCNGLSTSDFCDNPSGSTSHGDNYMPNQM